MVRPIQAEIDSAALRHNLAVVRSHAARSRVLAVVKANAYGHGLPRVANALADADGFALIEIDAAVRLRLSGYAKRIVLLQGVFDAAELALAAEHRLSIVVHCNQQIHWLDQAPHGRRFDVLLKLNTGMNRLGFGAAEADSLLVRLQSHPAIESLTLMAHFASADEPSGVGWQMPAFEKIAGTRRLPRTLANSAAIIRFPETHADWVRPGIMLYGCSPFRDLSAQQLGLRPAMTLRSNVIAVQSLKAGDQVGYGGLFRASHPMRIGIVACGYADGYPRHAPSGTPILVNGFRTRTVGRVAMDMLSVDISDIPGAGTGTAVTIWGDGISADEVALAAGTVSYELLCALSPRVPVIETNTVCDAPMGVT